MGAKAMMILIATVIVTMTILLLVTTSMHWIMVAKVSRREWYSMSSISDRKGMM